MLACARPGPCVLVCACVIVLSSLVLVCARPSPCVLVLARVCSSEPVCDRVCVLGSLVLACDHLCCCCSCMFVISSCVLVCYRVRLVRGRVCASPSPGVIAPSLSWPVNPWPRHSNRGTGVQGLSGVRPRLPTCSPVLMPSCLRGGRPRRWVSQWLSLWLSH